MKSNPRSRIINTLRQASGQWVSRDYLLDALYGEDPEGGPDQADKCLRVFIARLRNAGYPIENRYAVGYRMSEAA